MRPSGAGARDSAPDIAIAATRQDQRMTPEVTSLTERLPPDNGAAAVARGAPARVAALRTRSSQPRPEWRRYLEAIARRRWLVLGVTLLGTAAGVFAALRVMEPRYLVRARLWLGAEPAQGYRGAAPTPTPGVDRLLGVEGWVDLLQSHAVLDSVVREVRLYLTAKSPDDSAALVGLRVRERVAPGKYRLAVDDAGRAFTLSLDGNDVQRGTLGDSIGASLGLVWVPPAEGAALFAGRTIDFTLAAPHDAAEQLATDLRVEADPDGSFLRVELTGTDPQRTAATVNAVAQHLVAVAADLRRRKVSELADILGEQLRHAQATLADAETALKNFRMRTAAVLPPTGGTPPPPPAFAASFELRVELDQLQRDARVIERVLAQRGGDSSLAVDALAGLASVQRAPDVAQALKELTDKQAELRALRYTYTDQQLQVQQARDAVATLERTTIPALLGSLVEDLKLRARDLSQRVDSTVGYLARIPPLALEGAQLERDVGVAEQLFTTLQQRYNETRLAEASSLPDVRILDAAVEPHRPLTSLAPFVVLMSFLASAGLGMLGAVLLDQGDSRFRDPSRVTEEMGLRILGAVPHLSRRNGNGNGDGSAIAIEALRTVRVRLQHAHGGAGGGPLLVTITSPGVGEGKSLIAANLALAFAYAGHRTVLVDGDVRRGALHRLLDSVRRPGLVDHLIGRTGLDKVIQPTAYPQLSFIGCGSRMHSAPELLASSAMAELLAALRSTYDVVVVDTAPLAAGADPYAVASLTTNLLLVLRAGASDMELALAKLDAFEDLPVRILGAVLNDVRPTGAYRYYAYYVPGYETREEADLGPRKPLLGEPID
jgi:capsular exopolysaccharide synthesis family protein